MTDPTQFQKLQDLHAAGVLSDTEFSNAWSKLVAQQPPAAAAPAAPYAPPPTYAPPPNTHRPSRGGRRWPMLLLGGLAIAGVIAVIAVVAGGSGTSKIHVTGALDLNDPASASNSDGTSECTGEGGYSDISVGSEVVIADDTGKTLTITALGPGSVSSGECEFTFSADVPVKSYYGITISHRGTVKFDQTQMRAGPVLTLGDGS